MIETLKRMLTPLSIVKSTFLQDLRSDRYLGYILLLTALLNGFWIWYRVPNFGTADEYSRIIDPIKAAGYMAREPGLESLVQGVTEGRALGATFYLFGLVFLPIFLFILATGQMGEFASLGAITSRWTLWRETPVWFWIATILSARITNLMLAVGCVYLLYRIGTQLQGRLVGRLAAVALTLTLTFTSVAHEAGEDVPMLFFYLLSLSLVVGYIRSGERKQFLAACFSGGLAIAFKLTSGVIAILIGVSLLLRSHRTAKSAFRIDPRLLISGGLIGLLGVYIGIPSILFGGPLELATRISASLGTKLGQGRSLPWGYRLLVNTLQGIGWPLFIAFSLAVPTSIIRLLSSQGRNELEWVTLIGIGIYVATFGSWSQLAAHHVLPIIPLAALALGAGVVELKRKRPAITTLLIGMLLLTSMVFVAGGNIDYATDPRDEATVWIEANVPTHAEIVVFEKSVADVAAPHGREIIHYEFNESRDYGSIISNESDFTEWMLQTPERSPDYIQLTCGQIQYLNPTSGKAQAYPRRATFLEELVNGNQYQYDVVKTFGDQEAAADQQSLIQMGLDPEAPKTSQCIVILRRTDN